MADEAPQQRADRSADLAWNHEPEPPRDPAPQHPARAEPRHQIGL